MLMYTTPMSLAPANQPSIKTLRYNITSFHCFEQKHVFRIQFYSTVITKSRFILAGSSVHVYVLSNIKTMSTPSLEQNACAWSLSYTCSRLLFQSIDNLYTLVTTTCTVYTSIFTSNNVPVLLLCLTAVTFFKVNKFSQLM